MNNYFPVYGNHEDKYHTKNPISKILVRGFLATFDGFLSFLSNQQIKTICEVGCAEGELLKHIRLFFPQSNLFATDLSKREIDKAKENCSDLPIDFSVQNAENLNKYNDNSFDLTICCEVLEHLENPTKGIRELYRISKRYVLVSVPHEPIWRGLNLLRGKYINSFGNTPGHLNHWNISQFNKFLNESPLKPIMTQNPFPWQMVLLEKLAS